MDLQTFDKVTANTSKILGNVKPDQLDGSTPCASWDVRTLVNHIVGGAYWFAGSMTAGESPAMEGEAPDFTGGDIVATYEAGRAQALAAFAADGAMEKMVTLPFGTMPGGAFLGLATLDHFTHGWDLAKATGQSTDLDPGAADAVLAFAQMGIQDAVRGPEGSGMPFGPKVEAPAGASAGEQVLAFLGRKP